MKISQEFRKRLAPDAKKSELCLALDISRSTLNRWMSKENEKFGRLDLLPKISKVLEITQEEMFEKETA